MGRRLSLGWWCAAVVISLITLGACGGSKPPGPSVVPAKITLSPATSASLTLGSTLSFTATAQNGSGSAVGATFTFRSSDTSILNIAPNGVACAGLWDAAFSTCTPHNYGPVQVTATALGTTSAPTVVFVHPTIDNVTVKGILLSGTPAIQEPCLSQSQTMTVQATAYSQGADITAAVGPFTWSVQNPAVATVVPINDSAYKFPTSQATVTANAPGLTQIFAAADGVSSTSFLQPTEGGGPFDFFETCPIQNITLQLGGTQSGLTSFATNKGTSEPATATVTDVVGNNSLPNISGAPVLSKIPLTWSASQPAAVAASGCTQLTCSITTAGPGAGTVTASCTPPTCNVGFPLIPAILTSTTACTQFTPPDCHPFIPLPVYATTAISGQVTGTTSATSVIATSMGCADNSNCTAYLYNVSTSSNLPGTPTAFPTAPNSLLFGPAGTKAYAGSGFGAQDLNPANLGTTNNAFTPLNALTARVLAVSADGNFAVLSDTVHTPNQVFVVNTTLATPTVANLSISGATAAAFSPDGLKAYIFGFDSAGNPNVFVYSTLQALQDIPLPSQTTVNSIAFAPNGNFAYLETTALGSNTASLTAYNICNNQIATDPSSTSQVIPLPSPTPLLRVLPNVHLDGTDFQGFGFPDGVHTILLDSTGLDILTATITPQPVGTITTPGLSCPQMSQFITGNLNHLPNPFVQRIELGQGTLQPLNFFVSPDGTQVYIVASNLSNILVYSFATNSVSTAIPLLGNSVTPVSADMTVDGTMIYVVGNDGLLHALSTLSLSDTAQISFPFLPNLQNPFCSLNSLTGQPCVLDFVAVRP